LLLGWLGLQRILLILLDRLPLSGSIEEFVGAFGLTLVFLQLMSDLSLLRSVLLIVQETHSIGL
jgi:hypothetical protein